MLTNLKLKINLYRLKYQAMKATKAAQSMPDVDSLINKLLSDNAAKLNL